MGVCKRTVNIFLEFDIELQISGYYDKEFNSFEIENIELIYGDILDLIVHFSSEGENAFIDLEKLVLEKII
tara:strand:- start:1984 stop:2196 length:213 start_codon:yes stop_codon:yes gene_type:complete